jgi:tetratricopeptide (TPR) repeat protein
MSESPNKLIRFWQELKRRKTGKVIIAYAATAFILLQLADILTPALLLPEWTTRLVTLILIIGFPIAVIFSWVFDITPEGIKKTESIEVSESKKIVTTPAKRIFKTSNIIIAALIIVVGILAYPKIFKQDTLDKLRSSGERISVAVMPFQNMTNDTSKNILQGWIQDNLTNLLSNSEELKVKKTESVSAVINSKGITTYASITPSLAGSISRRLDADIFIYGNIKKDAATFRLTAQLIDSKTEEIFKYFQIDIPTNKDITNRIIDSLSIMIKEFLEVSKLKRDSPMNLQGMLSTINSPEAYRYFITGKKAFEKRDYPTVFDNLSKAIEIDTNFIYAPILLAQAYLNVGRFDEAKKLVLKQRQKRERMSYQMKTYTDWIYSVLYETPNEWIKYLEQLLEIDNQSPDYHYLLGWVYSCLNKYDKAIPEFQKALEINYKWDSKPWWVGNYTELGYAYHKTGQYRKEEGLYKKAEKDFPDDPALIYQQAILALTQKDENAANEFIEKYKSILAENSSSEADIIASIGWMYFEVNYLDKSEQYLRQALSFEPNNPDRLNSFAWLLIDKDRNINEGMELVDKVLVQSPDNYEYLDTKGWGLYKQGKYQEALDILQKSWDLRREKAVYNHEAFLHLEAAKKAVAGLK